MTKKVADLNFYAFVELYRILKEKFEGFHFDTSALGEEISYFGISKVPPPDIEELEVVLQIHEPLSIVVWGGDSALESADLDKNKIRIDFFIHSVDSFTFHVDKAHFDNPDFILKLRSIIGIIAPLRRNRGVTSEDTQKWLEEEIKKEGIEKYLGSPV